MDRKRKQFDDYIKANRKGSREAQLEISPGWVAKRKIHKNKKKYDRKDQNWKTDFDLFFTVFLLKITI